MADDADDSIRSAFAIKGIWVIQTAWDVFEILLTILLNWMQVRRIHCGRWWRWRRSIMNIGIVTWSLSSSLMWRPRSRDPALSHCTSTSKTLTSTLWRRRLSTPPFTITTISLQVIWWIHRRIDGHCCGCGKLPVWNGWKKVALAKRSISIPKYSNQAKI